MTEITEQIQDQEKKDLHQEATTLQQPVEAEQKSEENADPNWKAFREARKKDRQEREAAERRAAEKEAEATALKAAMEAAFGRQAPSPQAHQQYYGMNQEVDETEDQRIERKVESMLQAKESQFQQQHAERERREMPTKLSRELPDFDRICSQENLDYFEYHYPELARPLQRLPDSYEKWHDVYHAVKRFINTDAKKDAARADSNLAKPKSISTNNVTPTGTGGYESPRDIDARRAANWERMQRVMKGV